MKLLPRLGLSLHNPEDNFQKSDYYPFIQRLFDEEQLHSLKSHITVISYNYDSYLEYLLLKAQSHRNQLADIGEPDDVLKNRLSSCFFKIDDVISLRSLSEFHNQHFRLFKLHGSITYAAEPLRKQLFEGSLEQRLKAFESGDIQASITPIVFPWEVFDGSGRFITAQQFAFKKDAATDFQHSEATKLYNLFSSVWGGAREAVQRAEKISIVGMSMHRYLEVGLKYLFNGKRGRVEIVVANSENGDLRNDDRQYPPWSVCKRIEDVLYRVGTMNFVQNFLQANDAGPIAQPELQPVGQIIPRSSFADFIEKEMD